MRRTRYALSIGLCLFVLATLGYYYAYASDERLPSLKLETIEGDAKEGAALSLIGSYNGRIDTRFLTVTTEDSQYTRPSTFADRILPKDSSLTVGPDLKAIRKEHPNFMRGKSESMGWYQDKELLVYAVAGPTKPDRRLRLGVELLDERSGKIKRYSVEAENSQSYSSAYVADVQRVGTQLHVLVKMKRNRAVNGEQEGSGLNEVWDYVLDSANGIVIARHNLGEELKAESGADAKLLIGSITEESAVAQSDYALIKVTETRAKQVGDNVQEIQPLGSRLYSYSYRTGERKLLAPFKTTTRGSGFACTLSGNQASILQNGETPGSLAWTLFDVSTGEKKADLAVTAEQLGGTDFGTTIISHGRVYALVHDKISPQGGGGSIAAVLDAATGQVLYRGKAVITDPTHDGDKEWSRLELFNMRLSDER